MGRQEKQGREIVRITPCLCLWCGAALASGDEQCVPTVEFVPSSLHLITPLSPPSHATYTSPPPPPRSPRYARGDKKVRETSAEIKFCLIETLLMITYRSLQGEKSVEKRREETGDRRERRQRREKRQGTGDRRQRRERRDRGQERGDKGEDAARGKTEERRRTQIYQRLIHSHDQPFTDNILGPPYLPLPSSSFFRPPSSVPPPLVSFLFLMKGAT